MKQVRKAIIPVAGSAIANKPIIQRIVEEAAESGIEDIIIVTEKGTHAAENHFDMADELEHTLLQLEKYELLQAVRHSSALDICFLRQNEFGGIVRAIWRARSYIGNEPFAVLLGDEPVHAEIPRVKQLVEQYLLTGQSVVGVQDAMVGRCVFTPGFYNALTELRQEADEEILLIEVIRKLNETEGVYAYEYARKKADKLLAARGENV